MNFKNLSIRVKLLLIQLIFFVFLIIFTILITNFTSSSFENEAIKNLQKENSHIRDMIETYNESLMESTSKLESIFTDYFSDNFVVDNNRMIEVNGKKTPALLNEGILVNNNFSVVDHFYKLTGCVSTVFVRYEDDFYRITTSLKKEDGTRALGTSLDRNHPAYSKLLSGEEYIGKAKLFGKDYMTKYKPVIQNGKVIAVLFIGLEFSEGLKALKNKIKSLKVGETGYFFILDANVGKSYGDVLVHPTLESKNVIDVTDADNKPIFKTILEKKEGILYYNWKERDEIKEKVVAFLPVNEWNWIIASSAYNEEFLKDSYSLRNLLIISSIVLIIILVIILSFASKSWILKPLKELELMAKDLSSGKGDLTKRIITKTNDEIATVSNQINLFIEKIQKSIKEVYNNTLTVSGASEELTATSNQMAANAEEMSVSISTVGNAIESVSSSVNSVASAIEEMTYSINEVSQNCQKESQIASEASKKADRASEIMRILNDSAKRINHVVKMINEISEQTNLLALNATIEAARAGESGKGFAVVANEVKELSKQTANATNEISSQIKEIQQNSQEALSSIEEITKVIQEVDSISQTIATAVEQQSATVKEIANSISQANKAASGEIVSSIEGVKIASKTTAQEALELKESATELSKLSHNLQSIVNQFKIQ